MPKATLEFDLDKERKQYELALLGEELFKLFETLTAMHVRRVDEHMYRDKSPGANLMELEYARKQFKALTDLLSEIGIDVDKSGKLFLRNIPGHRRDKGHLYDFQEMMQKQVFQSMGMPPSMSMQGSGSSQRWFSTEAPTGRNIPGPTTPAENSYELSNDVRVANALSNAGITPKAIKQESALVAKEISKKGENDDTT